MKAIIMAGGRGSRLRPLTNNCPKPMMPFASKPVLEHILKLLKHHGITEVIITVHYLAERIQGHFKDGNRLGMRIQYAVETEPLGTAGGIKNAESFLKDETFLVISGDIITDIDLAAAWHAHRQKQAAATLIMKQVANPKEYGVVVTDDTGRVTRYLEKPDQAQPTSSLVNTGIYILEPQILALMQPNIAYDFSYDIFPLMLKQQVPLFGYQTGGYWSDMGTIEAYLETLADALNGKVKHLEIEAYPNSRRWLKQLASLEPEALSHEALSDAWFNYLPVYSGK